MASCLMLVEQPFALICAEKKVKDCHQECQKESIRTSRVGFSVVFVSYERFATLLNDVDMQKVHIQSAKTSSVVVDYRFMTALFSFVNSS